MAYDSLLAALGEWHAENQVSLAERGIRPAFRRSGPESLGDKPVAQLDLDNASHFGSLLLWNTGEAELNVIDLSGHDLLVEHRSVIDEEALRLAVSTLVSVVENGAPPSASRH